MNRFKTYTGGALETNCFLYETPVGNILFDAPEGADAAFADTRVDLLLLTHGHFDHVADGAAIIRRHGCKTAFHADTIPMVGERDFFRKWGFAQEVEPFAADFLIEEGPGEFLGEALRVFLVPGHCPGSLCFLLPGERVLVGGDVLFRGGVGRWDLPGGNRDILFDGIHRKLLPLDEDVVVLPGHGPATTIGRERAENPFLTEERNLSSTEIRPASTVKSRTTL